MVVVRMVFKTKSRTARQNSNLNMASEASDASAADALLSLHRDRLIGLHNTSELHAVLKEIGVRPMGKRLQLAGELRAAGIINSSPPPAPDTPPLQRPPGPSESNYARRAALKDQGNKHVAAGDLDAAIDAYEQALAIDCSNEPIEDIETIAALHSNLSSVLLRASRPEEAAVAAQRAIDARPLWAKGYYRRALACFDLGRATEAQSYLERSRVLCISDRERREIDLALEKLAATYNRGGDGIRDDDSDDDNGGVPGARRASTQRRVVPLNAERIPVHNSEAVRAHLLREGYVVVSGVADASELDTLRRLLWAHLEQTTPYRRGRPETWGAEGPWTQGDGSRAFPGPAHLGLLTWGNIGQSELLWKARCLPNVGLAFEGAWGLNGGDPMMCSFDGLTCFRPPQVDERWRSQEALEWLHVDQGATKRGLVGLQGALMLYDQDAGTGGFVCVPRSHLRHEALVPSHRQRDFVKFDPDDARLEGLGDARLICCNAGDLVLWDSRTVHASQPADPKAPVPMEPGMPGQPRLARVGCLICMTPAEMYVRAPGGEELKLRRRKLIEEACTTTHWPQEGVMTSQGPPGSGVGSVERLPPEGRALVDGERCEKRARWRRQQQAKQIWGAERRGANAVAVS